MQEDLRLIGQLYQDTLIYLNTQYDEFSRKVKYKAFVSLVIETKKAELESNMAQCFNLHGQIVSDFGSVKKKMKALKSKTRTELRQLV